MTKKLVKEEFVGPCVDFLREAGWSIGQERFTLADKFWDNLVRAGVFEEERKEGWYRIKLSHQPGESWVLLYWQKDRWWAWPQATNPVAESPTTLVVGSRIDLSKDC